VQEKTQGFEFELLIDTVYLNHAYNGTKLNVQ
jgi:hypothetical protein